MNKTTHALKSPEPEGMFSRPALAVQIADALRDLILEGELKGGEKIREKELTEHFGVSRTPLREAMKILASEGLLELVPNRGAIISSPSRETLQDAFPVLATLEGLAGEQAAARATDEEIAHIESLTRALRRALEKDDRPGYFQINQDIHNCILAASRNETLLRTHATVAGTVHRARYQANLEKSRWNAALDEHERIAKALSDRDGAEANRLLSAHMIAKLNAVMKD